MVVSPLTLLGAVEVLAEQLVLYPTRQGIVAQMVFVTYKAAILVGITRTLTTMTAVKAPTHKWVLTNFENHD